MRLTGTQRRCPPAAAVTVTARDHRIRDAGRVAARPLTEIIRVGARAGARAAAIWILATYDVVRHVRCRTSCTYDIVRVTYDIVLNIARTMSYVRYTGYRRTTSYVRHRT
jgi:hypothetical protein